MDEHDLQYLLKQGGILSRTQSNIDIEENSLQFLQINNNSKSMVSISDQLKSIHSTPWSDYLSILKVLIIFSCPSNTNPLRLQTEEKVIKEALFSSQSNALTIEDKISINILPACTIDDLKSNLLQNEYNVIQFSGHADRTTFLIQHIYSQLGIDKCSSQQSDEDLHKSVVDTAEYVVREYELQLSTRRHSDINVPVNILFESKAFTAQKPFIYNYRYNDFMNLGIGSLAFESHSGQATFITPAAFAELLSEQCSLQCVIVNACFSLIQANHVSSYVPLTICHNGMIADNESIAFSQGFYNSLRVGTMSFEKCYTHGLNNVNLKRMLPGMPRRADIISYEQLIVLRVNKVLSAERYQVMRGLRDAVNDTASMRQLPSNDNGEKSSIELENIKLKSLIGYGIQLLQSKDKELEMAKAMIKLMLVDCANPDTARLAEILISDKKIPITNVDVNSAFNLVSTALSSARSTSSTSSNERKCESNGSDKIRSVCRKEIRTKISKSTNSSGKIDRVFSDISKRQSSSSINRRQSIVSRSRVKPTPRQSTIACLKKSTNREIKIAFGYREPDLSNLSPQSEKKTAHKPSFSDIDFSSSNSSSATKLTGIPSPRRNEKQSNAEDKKKSTSLEQHLRESQTSIPTLKRSDHTQNREEKENIVSTKDVNIITAPSIDQIDGSLSNQSLLQTWPSSPPKAEQREGKLINASIAFRAFLKERKSAVRKSNAS